MTCRLPALEESTNPRRVSRGGLLMPERYLAHREENPSSVIKKCRAKGVHRSPRRRFSAAPSPAKKKENGTCRKVATGRRCDTFPPGVHRARGTEATPFHTLPEGAASAYKDTHYMRGEVLVGSLNDTVILSRSLITSSA